MISPTIVAVFTQLSSLDPAHVSSKRREIIFRVTAIELLVEKKCPPNTGKTDTAPLE